MALVLITAARFFAYSVRPVDFFLSGYQPSKLSKSSDDVRWLKIYAIEDLQKRITHNGKVLDRNIKTLRLGLCLMALAVPVGALAFFLLNHPS